MSVVDQDKLVQKKNFLWYRMCELMDAAKSEKRDLTAEEQTEYDRLEKQLADTSTELTTLEANQARNQRFEQLQQVAERKASLETVRQLPGERVRFTATPEYKRAWLHYMRNGRDGLNDDLRQVLSNGFQKNEPDDEVRAQTVTTTGGGYLIPEGFRAELMRAMQAFGGVRANAFNLATDLGNSLDIPTIDDTSNTGRLLTINTGVTETAMTFGQVTLDAYKYSSDLVLVPTELMEDSAFDMGGLVNSILAERLGRITETHYTTGDGSSKPRGVVTAATEGKVGTSGQTTTVIADDIMDLEHSIDPSYRAGASFMMNDSSVAALRKLKTGVSGDNTYIWQPGLQANMPDTLLGRPVIINQHMATMAASAKSILFGNFQNYWVRDVRGVRFVRLEERYAELDQIGFVVFLRTDGDLVGPSGTIKYYQNAAS